MQSAQWETGCGVIKLIAIHGFPAAFIVTALTVLAQFAFVHIFVAGCTGAELQWFQHVTAGVAFLAVDILVFAEQREACFRMIKCAAIHPAPASGVVAALAVCTEFALVHIVMACFA